MRDREKVKYSIERCISHVPDACRDCAYDAGHPYNECVEMMLNDVIALLKEQEAVTIKKTKEHGFGVYGGICPKCRNWIQSAHSFCGFCGQAVKWE